MHIQFVIIHMYNGIANVKYIRIINSGIVAKN